jgi:hypothetical protein
MKVRLTLTLDVDINRWIAKRGNRLPSELDARDEVKRELADVLDEHLEEHQMGKVIRLQ